MGGGKIWLWGVRFFGFSKIFVYSKIIQIKSLEGLEGGYYYFPTTLIAFGIDFNYYIPFAVGKCRFTALPTLFRPLKDNMNSRATKGRILTPLSPAENNCR